MKKTAALYSGNKTYFFAGDQCIRLTRGTTGGGKLDPCFPTKISDYWGWGNFATTGISAAFQSGENRAYFFSDADYIRVSRRRGSDERGTVDPSFPKRISPYLGSSWGSFGRLGIDAALRSGSRCYFFSGPDYIRVKRAETGTGTLDPNYPVSIARGWKWGDFGRAGIDAVLDSGPKTYFFSGPHYIRVTRGEMGSGKIDPGYPKTIEGHWDWPREFLDLWLSA